MVTDCMTEREIVAFSRALRKLGRGTTQITGPLDTAALIARESGRPIIWNALAPTGAVNQHGEFRYPHLETIARLDQLNQEEGVRVFASAQIVRFKSEINFEDYNLMDIFPAWQEATLGTPEEKIGKLSDPERRPKLKEAIDTLGGGFGAARYPLAEITVNWISSDAPNAAGAEGDATRATPSARSPHAKASTSSTPCSTSRWRRGSTPASARP